MPEVVRCLTVLRTASGREVEVSLFGPPQDRLDVAAIVFSHGANSAPGRYRRLFDAWAAAGFLVCAPLHVDSEDHPDRMTSDRSTVREFRLEDFALVAAALANGAFERPETCFVAAGHSYGALIAQVAGGARLDSDVAARMPAIERPVCVVALSPPPPMLGLVSDRSWQTLDVPMLCVTGTADEMPAFVDDWRLHLASHRVAQRSFAAVFDGMDHYFNGAFGRLKGPVRGLAVDALNEMVIAFVRKWACEGGVTPEQWAAASTAGVLRFV